MATLPDTTGFYKSLAQHLDLVCDCRFVFSVEPKEDGFMYCNSCGRYVPTMDEV